MEDNGDLFSLRPRIDDQMRAIDHLTDELRFIKQLHLENRTSLVSSIEENRRIIEEAILALKDDLHAHTKRTDRKMFYVYALTCLCIGFNILGYL